MASWTIWPKLDARGFRRAHASVGEAADDGEQWRAERVAKATYRVRNRTGATATDVVVSAPGCGGVGQATLDNGEATRIFSITARPDGRQVGEVTVSWAEGEKPVVVRLPLRDSRVLV